jgi:hypothetical protein
VIHTLGCIAPLPIIPDEPACYQVAVPGSGMTALAFPSPGRYEVAKSGDALLKTSRANKSMFQSKTVRFPGSALVSCPGTIMFYVGPAYYHPIPSNKNRSFHLGVSNSWV